MGDRSVPKRLKFHDLSAILLQKSGENPVTQPRVGAK